jgi:hypothetical protein
MATTESKTTVAISGSEEEQFGQLDQGLRAWTVVFGAWCCLFCAFGWVNGELPSYSYLSCRPIT